MEGEQSQDRIRFQYSYNPRPLHGDLAIVSDPYASSPYGYIPVSQMTDEQLGLVNAAETCSYGIAPKGSRYFEMHAALPVYHSFGDPDSFTWDDLASNLSFPEPNFFPVQSAEMDQQSTSAASQIMPTDIQGLFASEKRLPCTYEVEPFLSESMEIDHHDQADLVAKFGIKQVYQNENTDIIQLLLNEPASSVSKNVLGPPSSGFEESLWEDVMDPTPAPQIIQRNLSKKKLSRSKQNFVRYRRTDPTKIISTELPESQGEFGQLDVGLKIRNFDRSSFDTVSQERPRKESACIGCRWVKKKCEDEFLESRCRRCLLSGSECLSTKDFLPNWDIPESKTESRLETSSLLCGSPLNAISTVPKIFRASIYVGFGTSKLGVPLRCKVAEIRSDLNYTPRSTSILEDFNSMRQDKNCIQKDRLRNFLIHSKCKPSAESLLNWAIESIEKLPSGIVEDCFGPFYTFSANYIKVGTRPLYDLVALTLIHTAIYNVCHSRMTIVFDRKPQASSPVPFRLRDQICTSILLIFNITGKSIRQKITAGYRGRSRRECLAFYAVLYLLILTYEHISGETFKTLDLIQDLENQDPRSEWNKCQKNLRDLRALQECLFGKNPDLNHKDFDLSWKGDKSGEDDHELKEALLELRKSMPQHPVPKIRAESIILRILAPQLYMSVAPSPEDEGSRSDIHTVSTSKKNDFDNMSADTGLEDGQDESLPSEQQILEKTCQLRLR